MTHPGDTLVAPLRRRKQKGLGKLCRDCRYVELGWLGRLFGAWSEATCTHPRVVGEFENDFAINPVSGEWDDDFGGAPFCELARNNAWEECGPEGSLWEPK